MALIKLVNIGQQFKDGYALQGINLEIDQGEVFALIGPTGAGKTTFIRLIALLDTTATGRILFDGIDVTRSKRQRLETRRRMAFVQQKPIVFSMNVYDNIACGLKWRHQKSETIRQRVNTILEMVGMSDYRNRDARTLSGGETQRIAIARALVTEPEVLLLDEPTANLDPISTENIEQILEDVIRARKTTIIMSTHDMSQGQRLANKMGVLMDGEVLQVGTPSDVFRSPIRKRVADFVGVGNMLAGTVANRIDASLAAVAINGSTLQVVTEFEEGAKVWVLIRTEDVTFALSQTTTSARNVFLGPITKMTPHGTLVRIEIDCGFPLMGVVTTRSVNEMGLEIGKRIYASFKATAVHVIRNRSA